VDPEFDELVDRNISESLAGQAEPGQGEIEDRGAGYRRLASEISRVLTEESPRLTTAAESRHLAQLRARAKAKRGGPSLSFRWLLHAAPRWAQVAAVAVVVVLLANGITVASASSLPGSPLYPVKRLAEQSNVFFTPTAGERALIWMDLASRRLDEVQRVLAIQPRVDPKALDDIDESILHALTEIAATRGPERIALLKQIIQLSLREQNVLDDLAQEASSDDRTRFQQSAQLLEDVAHIADSAQTNLVLPTNTLTATGTETGTATATGSPTETGTPTDTMTSTPVPPTVTPTPSALPPTDTPTVESQSSGGGGASGPVPGPSSTTQKEGGPNDQPTATPEHRETEPGDGEKTGTPGPWKTGTPEHQKTETPDAQRTRTPDTNKTRAPDTHNSSETLGREVNAPQAADVGASPSYTADSGPSKKRGLRNPREGNQTQNRRAVPPARPHRRL
jgi:hypothetical protein